MDLGLYERAYLCGGPDRAARTALVSLYSATAVHVSESSPHRLERVHRRPGHVIELALLDSLPSSGMPVRLVLRKLAESPDVDRCAAVLLRRKLLRRSFRGSTSPTRAGVELRGKLTAEVADDALMRFAVVGTAPVALRPVIANLPPEATFPIKLPRRVKRGHDDRGDYNPPLGYADGYGL